MGGTAEVDTEEEEEKEENNRKPWFHFHQHWSELFITLASQVLWQMNTRSSLQISILYWVKFISRTDE